MAEATGSSGLVDIKIEIKEEPVFVEASATESEDLEHTDDPLKEEIKDEEEVDVDLLKDEVIVGEPSCSSEEASRLMQNITESTSSAEQSLTYVHILRIGSKEDIEERIYECGICYTEFTLKTQLKEHMSLHNREGLYFCIICERNFVLRRSLKKHMLSCHAVNKCDICGKMCCIKHYVAAHILNAKYHPCESCTKVYTELGELKRHKTVHHGTPRTCETCGRSFNSSYLLNVHKLYHTRLGPYTCETCRSTFDSKETLKSHFLEHVEG